ncbi:hypothetical protein QQS21_007896 [Conoideocrella luteorostrata]|uniref:Uncharacterized protein n=1 Tax=Conoideocrella luteorostrata TaxID=1105319 RepID=A0AAJ0FZ38_9HYPO|nr:hypothetical protein QQS21_007896 [Conoideocrella luteorostrata]
MAADNLFLSGISFAIARSRGEDEDPLMVLDHGSDSSQNALTGPIELITSPDDEGPSRLRIFPSHGWATFIRSEDGSPREPTTLEGNPRSANSSVRPNIPAETDLSGYRRFPWIDAGSIGDLLPVTEKDLSLRKYTQQFASISKDMAKINAEICQLKQLISAPYQAYPIQAYTIHANPNATGPTGIAKEHALSTSDWTSVIKKEIVNQQDAERRDFMM